MTALRRRSPDPRQLCLLDLSEMSWVATKPANDVPSPAPLPAVERRKRRVPYQMPLFEGERPYVIGQSYGVCQIIRATGGDATSGAQRAKMTEQVDDLLLRFFETQWEEHGEEWAVMRTFELIAGARAYRIPDWFLESIVEWKQELLLEFSGTGPFADALPDHDVYSSEAEPKR